MEKLAKERKGKLFVPSADLCTDNAFMIAQTGMMKLKKGFRREGLNIKPYQRIDEVK